MQWKPYLSVGVTILTCPCHLPLLVAALAGTALGGWLSQHSLEVTLGMAGMFVVALLYSFGALTRPETMPESRGQARKETWYERALVECRLHPGSAAGAICCLGPLMFAALGLSTFVSLWILRHLVPYQHVFFGVTFVLLGLGFYATYRRGRQTRRIDKALVWIATALVIGLLGYSLYVERFVFL